MLYPELMRSAEQEIVTAKNTINVIAKGAVIDENTEKYAKDFWSMVDCLDSMRDAIFRLRKQEEQRRSEMDRVFSGRAWVFDRTGRATEVDPAELDEPNETDNANEVE